MSQRRIKKVVLCAILSLAAFHFPGCSSNKQTETKDDSRNLRNPTSSFIYNMIPASARADITPQYSTAINTFSVSLLGEVYKNETFLNKNVVLSPFSVSRNLSIIAEGATGESKVELLEALGGRSALDDAKAALAQLLYSDNSVILQCADAIWIDSNFYTLNQTFKDTANRKYGVEASEVDLNDIQGTVNTINRWIAENTNNRIKDVVDPRIISPLTSLFLTGSIYFEADWASPFDVTKTKKQGFFGPTGNVRVDMMSSGYFHHTRKTDTYDNAKLYYGSEGKDYFYLDVYMPTTVTIQEFIDQECLSALSIDGDESVFGHLKMPRFFFESKLDLKPMLMSLGIQRIFDQDRGDLTQLANHKSSREAASLYVENIFQKAGIKTNEEGTVAYAATVAGAGVGSAGSPSPDVVLDRPFVYFVRAGENGLVLFAGVVNNPNEN